VMDCLGTRPAAAGLGGTSPPNIPEDDSCPLVPVRSFGPVGAPFF